MDFNEVADLRKAVLGPFNVSPGRRETAAVADVLRGKMESDARIAAVNREAQANELASARNANAHMFGSQQNAVANMYGADQDVARSNIAAQAGRDVATIGGKYDLAKIRQQGYAQAYVEDFKNTLEGRNQQRAAKLFDRLRNKKESATGVATPTPPSGYRYMSPALSPSTYQHDPTGSYATPNDYFRDDPLEGYLKNLGSNFTRRFDPVTGKWEDINM